MFSSKFYLSIFAFVICANMTSFSVGSDNRAQNTVLSLLGCGVVKYLVNAMVENKTVKGISSKIGITPSATEVISSLETILIPLGFLAPDAGFHRYAKRIPVGFVAWRLVNSKMFQKIVNNIPFFGQELSFVDSLENKKLVDSENISMSEADNLKAALQTITLYMIADRTIASKLGSDHWMNK